MFGIVSCTPKLRGSHILIVIEVENKLLSTFLWPEIKIKYCIRLICNILVWFYWLCSLWDSKSMLL